LFSNTNPRDSTFVATALQYLSLLPSSLFGQKVLMFLFAVSVTADWQFGKWPLIVVEYVTNSTRQRRSYNGILVGPAL